MTRTVLVTGGAGFLGSHVIQRILDVTDWWVVSIDSFRHNGAMDRLLAGSVSARERVTSITHDLTVPFTVRQVQEFDKLEVSAVLNLASRSHVQESIVDPMPFVRNNVELTLNALELARALGVDRFVQMSTDEVYGPRRPQSVYEHRPSSPYAASKAAQESICHAYQRTYGIPITIVNSVNMFGERQQPTAFIPLVINHLLCGASVPVHFVGDEPGTRNYSYVGNVAALLVDLVATEHARHREWAHGQETWTNVDVVEHVARLLNVEPCWRRVNVELERPGYDPTYPSLEGSWAPPTSLQEGLKRTVDWGVIYFNEDR